MKSASSGTIREPVPAPFAVGLAGAAALDRDKRQPLTQQLCDHWRTAIAAGKLRQGTQLPSSRTLARQLGVSRNTVSLAVDQLVAEGYLEVRQGRRPHVAVRLSPEGAPSLCPPPSAPAPHRLSAWAQGLASAGWPFADSRMPRPFQPGVADPRLFPHDLWARCLRRVARARPGHVSGRLTSVELQTALMAHLAEWRGVQGEPSQLVALPSAQAALGLVARCMLNPGDVAWTEDPGYPGAWAALASAGAIVRGVPLSTEGLAIPQSGRPPKLIFTTPSHQYPTGMLMPVNGRLELIRFAAQTDAIVVEDDYDGAFHFDGRPVAALQGLGNGDDIIYVGTFAKTMRPDIRIGYLVVPAAYVPVFEAAQRHTGLIVPLVMQQALAAFIADGHFAAHIRRMTRIYHARRDLMLRELEVIGRPYGVRVARPAGGIQLLAELDPGLDDEAVSRAAGALGLTIRPLSRHFIGESKRRGLFLGFAAWDDHETRTGLAAMRCALKEAYDDALIA